MAKNVLVTGGCGFIGSEVLSQLIGKGYHVRIADNLSKKRTIMQERGACIRVDLTDSAKTGKIFEGVDYCIHLAAKIGGIGYYHKYSATILSENNKICSSVFEAAAKNKIEKLIYVSSSMVFERANMFPSREEDLGTIPSPLTAYGFSKLIGERYCKAFSDQFRLPYSICRPFNAYGINEYPEEEVGYAHVIPDITKKILTGNYPLEILGNGEQTRCFTHVADIAAGIIAVMESPNAIGEDFNISSPEEMKIVDLARKLWGLCGMKKPFAVKFIPGFPYDQKRRAADITKILKRTGWKPKISLDDGLAEVVAWMKKEFQR